MKEWAASVQTSGKRLAIPIMTHPGIDFIGKTVFEAVTDGKIHYEAIKALSLKYPAAASTIIMDLTVEAEAFGCGIIFNRNELPSVAERLVSDAGSVKLLKIPDLNAARVRQYISATRLASENLTAKPVFAGCIGPMSLAGRIYDMTEIMTAMYTEPEMVHLLLEKCKQFITLYALALKTSGANGIIMAEPAAGLLSPDLCDEFSSRYVREIVGVVQDDYCTIILHNCGNTGHLNHSMISTGAAALHFGNKANMKEVLNEIPTDILVMGNLDPVDVFMQSTSDQVNNATLKLLEETRDCGNFIISSGCDTPANIPVDNIDAFYDAVDQFNNQ